VSTPAAKPSLIEQAKKMAHDGFGWEDLHVRLKIAKATAYWFVIRKPRWRQQ
jgi:orotate phosphoribosyltransferase-like protein